MLERDISLKSSQVSFLLQSLQFILENNYFIYNGNIYHQCKGTAMGTQVAPSFANLFMGEFEELHITKHSIYKNKIIFFRRYIDYIFIIWDGDELSAKTFCQSLNETDWGITFTLNFNKTEIEFLDIIIQSHNSTISTKTYFKPVDSNSYIHYSSFHHKKWLQNIPYSQFKRIRRNCTYKEDFIQQTDTIRKRFSAKKYPAKLIKKNALKKSSIVSQEECLIKTSKKQEKQDHLNFITQYSTSNGHIKNVLAKHWHILLQDPYLSKHLAHKPIITYRRAPTIKSILAASKPRQHNEPQNKSSKITAQNVGSYKCRSGRCLCCRTIAHKTTFMSNRNKTSFPIKQHMTCQSSYVIYLIECSCGLQYVGRTTQELHCRLNQYRYNIRRLYQKHGLSRHCATTTEKQKHPIKIYT